MALLQICYCYRTDIVAAVHRLALSTVLTHESFERLQPKNVAATVCQQICYCWQTVLLLHCCRLAHNNMFYCSLLIGKAATLSNNIQTAFLLGTHYKWLLCSSSDL